MTRSRWRVALSCAALLSSAATVSCDTGGANVAAEAEEKRDLALMTSLPLVWGDAQDIEAVIAGNAQPHPFYVELQKSYEIQAIDSLLEENVLGAGNPDILLLAQNRPLNPDEFVALDNWIRKGGRALIMADPLLRMESGYAIGDKRRPEGVSLMSPLFNRWGLDFTFDEDKAGFVEIKAGEYNVRSVAVGGFSLKHEQQADVAICNISDVAMLARCQIGEGRATLIADADVLDVELLSSSDNVAFIGALLNELHRN